MKVALDCDTNSPCQHLKKCKNSLKNVHTDVWAKRVKQKATKVLVKLHATPARTVPPPTV